MSGPYVRHQLDVYIITRSGSPKQSVFQLSSAECQQKSSSRAPFEIGQRNITWAKLGLLGAKLIGESHGGEAPRGGSTIKSAS